MRHIHLGLGRFHKAHQALYLQKAGYKITAFSMRSAREADALRDGGHRYRVRIVGEGKEETVPVTAIDEALFLQHSDQRFIKLMADPEVRTLTLTITEKGYGGLSEVSLALKHLVTGIAWRQAYSAEPLNILSCDNLTGNGDRLRELCEHWSRELDCPIDFGKVSFPNSMVDRIVPAGDDPLLITTEQFHQWVIEDKFSGGRPAWEQDGVYFTPEVEPFEKLKLGLLNGSHSFLAYYGQLKGHTYVHEAINDSHIRGLVEKLYFDEVGPLLDIPEPLTLKGYGEALLRRFNNPALPHRLNQIAMDGSQKVPIRFLPYLAQSSVLQTALSAWFSYMWKSLGGDERYVVSDPEAEALKALWNEDFQLTVKAWFEYLNWDSVAVELL